MGFQTVKKNDGGIHNEASKNYTDCIPSLPTPPLFITPWTARLLFAILVLLGTLLDASLHLTWIFASLKLSSPVLVLDSRSVVVLPMNPANVDLTFRTPVRHCDRTIPLVLRFHRVQLVDWHRLHLLFVQYLPRSVGFTIRLAADVSSERGMCLGESTQWRKSLEGVLLHSTVIDGGPR